MQKGGKSKLCGRYTRPFESDDLEDRFELSNNIGPIEQSYNVSPGEYSYIVTKNSPKKGVKMKWGYIAPWEKDPSKAKFKPINARNDKLTGGFYKQSFTSTRCLVPAGGYYEWRKLQIEGKPFKQPYYFKLKNEDIFSFGGIYSVHKDAEGKENYFYAIITTEPNSLQKPIHDRMPLIIPREKEDEWLDTDKPKELVKPFDSELMEVWRVNTWVNSGKEDGPRLIEKLPES